MGILSGGDSNNSNITGLGEYFDPTSWFMPEPLNPHTYIKPATDALNAGLSTVTKPINRLGSFDPTKKWVDDNFEIARAWNDTVENRPVDAAGIAAALYFGGGAAGLGSGASTAGSGLGTAGNAAANAALTGGSATGAGAATGAGIGSLGSAGTAYGTAALGGAGAAGANTAAFGAGGGLGGLGAAGTAAGMSALTPAFASTGAATGGTLGSYMGQLYDKAKEIKGFYDKGKTVYDLLQPGGQDQPLDRQMELTDPYKSQYFNDPNRFRRGY